ncbi:MAG: L-aspartate oxidase [Clostridiales bacterium]|jgi:L-aspartate oxidase|nr:L-aspartate oxidase [Clostridiales bacterium]
MKYRYLIDFDTKKLKKEYHDVLIIGSGIAGVYTALELDGNLDIAILTKEKVDISNSSLAQGGIAVSLDKNDSPEMHMKDTLYAGVGLCNEESVRVLVGEAAENVSKICEYGVNFDKEGSELALGREAAHSTNRIIHAGDSTGKEVLDKLILNVTERKNIIIKEEIWVIELLTEGNICFGLLAIDEQTGEITAYYSKMVICASGGYGQLYFYTTNPEVSTGDGAAFSYRAGAELSDMEFIQFHPTVLYHPLNKSFLISEAVRGEGGILRNGAGDPFMQNYHELKELAPRDVVARSIFNEMRKTGAEHVWLDITHKSREFLEARFPMIFKTCLDYGIDISKDYIPVAPAEHYCMGGIRTDIYGNTEIKNFYACGEADCNGIHGANRLASNSLLEGLVFGRKISKEANSIVTSTGRRMPDFSYTTDRETIGYDRDEVIMKIKHTMTDSVGIIRTGEGLKEALTTITRLEAKFNAAKCVSVKDYQVQNMLLLAKVIIESALWREESRGAHYRSDFPSTDNINWRKNIIRRIAEDA